MRTFQRVSRLIRPEVGLPVLAVLALVGLMVMAHGCGPKEQPLASPPAFNPRLPDVPVPHGFKFNTGKSYDRIVGGFRDVRHAYEGDAELRQVAEFYRIHMPSKGWTLKEEGFSNGAQRFTYEKGTETCYISIRDWFGTKLYINVIPGGVRASEPPGSRSTGP